MAVKRTINEYCERCGELDVKELGPNHYYWGIHKCKRPIKGRQVSPPRRIRKDHVILNNQKVAEQ